MFRKHKIKNYELGRLLCGLSMLTLMIVQNVAVGIIVFVGLYLLGEFYLKN